MSKKSKLVSLLKFKDSVISDLSSKGLSSESINVFEDKIRTISRDK